MPTTTEIAQMRQQGMLSEAYDAIRYQLQQTPNDYSVILAAAWIYHDLIKQNAQYPTRAAFDRYLTEFLAIGVREEEFSIYESIVWDIRRMLASAAKIEYIDYAWLDSLVGKLRAIPIQKNSSAYHSLLSAAIKIRGWIGVIEFINWWGLEHLTEEDYQHNTNSQGMNYMGLAESTYYALCRAMLMLNDEARQSSFIDKIQRVINKHPDYRFLPYYKAKLLFKLDRQEEALASLRHFAQSNDSAFWVWQLLGDEHRDVNDKMMFYIKAVTCPAADNMVVKLQEHVGRFLISRNMAAMGKFLIEKAVQTRQKEGSHISYAIENMRQESWYQTLEPAWDEHFVAEQVKLAENYLFAELPQFPVMVTYTNEEKRIVSFFSEELQEGFFRIPKSVGELPQRGQILIVKAPQLAVSAPTAVRSFDIDKSNSNPHFFKAYNGMLRINFNGYGFVDDVFVETKLTEGLTNGAAVSGIARKTYNKKKESWGWYAVTIQHN